MNKLSPNWLCLALILIASTSQAATIQDQITEREAEIVKVKAELSKVNTLHGTYRLVRDEYYQGPHGVVTQFDAFSKASAAWLNKWGELKEVTNLVASVPTNNIQALAERITSAFLEQTNGVANLERLVQKLTKTTEAAQDLLGHSHEKPVAQNFKEQYRPYVTAILKDVDALERALRDVPALTSPIIAKLRTVEEPSKTAFLQKIRAVLIASGRFPVETALQEARNAIQVEELIDSNLSDVNRIYRNLTFQISKRRVLHAEEKLQQLKQRVAQARQQIANSGLGDTQRGLDWLDRTQNQAQSDYQTMIHNGKPTAVYQQSRFMKQYFKDKCLATPKLYNCDLLKTLSQIKREQIEAMNETEIKAFEYAWDQIGQVEADDQEN